MMQRKTLLYNEIADRIRAYILAEQLPPGAFLPPERGLAEHFQVSTVTLKKALKVLCDENVLTTVPRRGTRINAFRSPEATPERKRKRIGLTVLKDWDVFHSDAVRAIRAAGEVFPAEDYEVIIVYVSAEMIYAESWEPWLNAGLDGLLMVVQGLPPAMLDNLRASALPTVFMDCIGITPGVWIDEKPGIAMLMKYLVELGHRRIAFISGPDSQAMVQAQLRAFRDCRRDFNCIPDERCIASTPYERPAAFAEAMRMLELPEAPTAFLLGNEFMAQGALDALLAHGLKCPEDVSVACFGAMSLSRQSYPQLSILTSSSDRSPCVFRTGAQLLRDMLENRLADTEMIIERELVVRESTAPRRGRSGIEV